MSDDAALWLHARQPVEAASDGMVDYKFYCFDGEPRFLYVSQGLDNHESARISFLSMNWEFMPFRREDYSPFEELPKKPSCFSEMVDCAKKLSEGMPFVRADFYGHGGRALFSEMTFCPCAGFMPFCPPDWDAKVGSLLDISEL